LTLENYDAVELLENKLVKGREDLIVKYRGRNFGFKDMGNLIKFMVTPHLYEGVKLPIKNPIKNKKALDSIFKGTNVEGSSSAYLENSVGNILMKSMAL
jgi:hypothetical protein